MQPDEQVAKGNRAQVLIMAVAFPLLAAFGVYSLIWLAQRDSMLETTNLGQFVDPPVLARELGLGDGSGTPVDGSGNWWVWLVTERCTAACAGALREMGTLRQRLHEQGERVRLALITPPQAEPLPPPDRYPQVSHFTSDGEKALNHGIYLVDPVGNVVLSYPADTGPQPVLEDLARLLEVDRDA